MNTKKIIKNWIPLIIYRLLSNFSKSGIQFEGSYSSWEEARSQCSGYDSDNILKKVLESTLKVKNGEAAFERDSVLFYEPEYVWPVLSGLLLAATQNQGKLNVLDFGGALGSIYFQHKIFLQEISKLTWNIVEQEHYIKIGKKYIQNETLRFYSTIEECKQLNNINVILLSSVLQYIPNTTDVLGKLLQLKPSIVIIDRTFYLKNSLINKISGQKVSKKIYNLSLPCHILSTSLQEDFFKSHFYSLIDDEVITIHKDNIIEKRYIWKK